MEQYLGKQIFILNVLNYTLALWIRCRYDSHTGKAKVDWLTPPDDYVYTCISNLQLTVFGSCAGHELSEYLLCIHAMH